MSQVRKAEQASIPIATSTATAADPIIVISVTPAQAKIAKWAIDPMADYADDPDAEFGEEDIPIIETRSARLLAPNILVSSESVLIFPNTRAIGDFLYRIEEQLPDMASQSDDEGWRPGSTASHVAAARRLGAKIRAIAPEPPGGWVTK